MKDVLFAIFLLGCAAWSEAKKSDRATLLSNVKTLTLYGDKKTSHRRVSAIPQLACVGGSGCQHYNVDIMRCQNAGSEYDAGDIQWTCTAEVPPEFKLGSTEVVCEGYDNADDPWVLKGSCGVEYRLVLTDEGERKYAKSKPAYKSKQDDYSRPNEDSEGSTSSVAQFLFWLVFMCIICLILYRIFYPSNGGAIGLGGNNRPGWGGGGGRGDGWDNPPFDDPPPPYSPGPSSQPRWKPTASRTSTGGSSRNSGPGFWTGAATGGAAGYGAGYYHGSRTAEAERRQRERERERERERDRSSPSWFGSGSGRNSGGGGGGFFSGSSGGASPGPSSSRQESTGFGGTRRR